MKCIFTAFSMVLIGSVHAQMPVLPDLPALRVIPTGIGESRTSTGEGGVTLHLSISGDRLPALTLLRAVSVTKAVDDKDRSMRRTAPTLQSMLPSAMFSQMMARLSAANPRGGPEAFLAMVQLASPARTAASIKYVEGTIELYLPSESNGSMLRIPAIMSHVGLVEHPVLAKHGIKYHFYADQAAYDATREMHPAINSRAAPHFPTELGYYQMDPSNLVLGFQLQDPAGNPVRTVDAGSSVNGMERIGTIRLAAPQPRNAQLVIFLSVPEAIRTVPFRIENIPLP